MLNILWCSDAFVVALHFLDTHFQLYLLWYASKECTFIRTWTWIVKLCHCSLKCISTEAEKSINHTCSPFWRTSLRCKSTIHPIQLTMKMEYRRAHCNQSTNIDDHFHGNFPMFSLFIVLWAFALGPAILWLSVLASTITHIDDSLPIDTNAIRMCECRTQS